MGEAGLSTGASATQVPSSRPESESGPSSDDSTGPQHVQANACPICLDGFAVGDEQRILPCFHAFHRSCVDAWLHTHFACPCCRHELTTDGSEEVSNLEQPGTNAY